MASNPHNLDRANASATLFGAPIGDLGWFASLLMGTATGFAAFFAATFCAIITILILNTSAHRNIDFSASYRLVGLPVGALVLVLSLGYLGTLWFRRQLRRS